MPPSPIETIRRSVLYSVGTTVANWVRASQAYRLLNDDRVLAAALIVFLLFSLVRVLTSGLNVTVQFLSFATLFVLLTALTWRYTEPLADG